VPDIADYHVAGAAGSRSNRQSERYVDVDSGREMWAATRRTPTKSWGCRRLRCAGSGWTLCAVIALLPQTPRDMQEQLDALLVKPG
jgi:hypothetical protein